jgi:hypothetical protein
MTTTAVRQDAAMKQLCSAMNMNASLVLLCADQTVDGDGAHTAGARVSLLFPGIINWKRWSNNKNIQERNTQVLNLNIRI